MDTFGARLKYAIKESGKTAKQFAEEVGVSAVYISNLCTDRDKASEKLTGTICRTLGINKRWLLTGKGDMYDPEDRLQAIARLTNDIIEEDEGSFKSRLIVALSKLNADDWKTLKKIYTEILGEE